MKSKDVIWINGMPRSGTSWLSQIFDSHPNISFKLSPLFSYAFKNFVDENSSKQEWFDLFERVFVTKDDFINQNYRRESGEYPIFIKNELTKLVIKDTRYHNLTDNLLKLFSDIKFIHIVRHPCGAINSWLKAPKEFPQNLNPLEEWRTAKSRKKSIEEFWGFDDWLFLTKKYLKLQEEFPNNVRVVFYEDLVHNIYTESKKMFEFVNLKIGRQTMEFLEKSQNSYNESEYAVFKNKDVATQWKTELHPEIINSIEEELIINNLTHFFEPKV
ncbi:sulfotransferase family protein [Formosa maritima]|uniref:Sulfotransferase n=1 Tax=Formosa maritima TaxID=2592046 RepID=A0A5D0GD07_9FLAO|nr:sulfotransferase [Formosa maritima]TYA56641.1 sulfotransferase [Formosa maritima]